MRVLTFAVDFLFNILLLFLMVFTCYANLGCDLFGVLSKGSVLDDLLNFQDFPKAMLTLFKCVCIFGWRNVMTDTTYLNPFCSHENPEYCGSKLSYLYFVTFMILCRLILLNLFVLALVEQFEGFFDSQDSPLETYVEHIDKFRTVWCKYSYDTRGVKMHTKYLANFLLELGDPLGS